MWPWVGFLTLALSIGLLILVIAMAWLIGIGRRRFGRDQSDAERAETRALLAEAERVGSQFSRF
jgi:hypothetical protein